MTRSRRAEQQEVVDRLHRRRIGDAGGEVLLVAALLSPRPPPLLLLNEPEASLPPDLIAPLARLIGAAAERAQVVVVSHAPALVEALDTRPGARRFTLSKRLGRDGGGGETALGWTWPER